MRRRSAALLLLVGGVSSGLPRHAHAQGPAVGGTTTPVTLPQVLESVAARYPSLAAALARVRGAQGDRMTAGTLGNPVVQYQAENTAFPLGPRLVGIASEHMTTATLPVMPWYQRGARVRQADAGVRAAEADVQATSQLLALDAARAFYRTALAQVSADAAQDLAEWLDSVVVYNTLRVQQGAAAEADLIRSQLERDNALANAGVEAAELARARASLAAYLADDVDPRALLVAQSDAPLSLTLVGIPGEAGRLGQRTDLNVTFDSTFALRLPSLRAARERVAAAHAGTTLEHRLILRDVGATIGVKQTGGVTSMVAGFSLPVPVFDLNRGSRARAQADRDAAEFDLRTQTRVARGEWRGARDAAEILSRRTGTLSTRDSLGRVAYLARADAGRLIALGAYREGAVSLLQVLDAARTWAEARVTFHRALYAQHEAVLALIVAQGDDLRAALPTISPTSR